MYSLTSCIFVNVCGGYEELFGEDLLQCETCSESFYEHFFMLIAIAHCRAVHCMLLDSRVAYVAGAHYHGTFSYPVNVICLFIISLQIVKI